MRWTLCLAAAALAAGCGFDTRSNEYTCDTQSDCSDGRTCELGWCVTTPQTPPDASTTNPPDADRRPDAGRPLSACNSCMGNECHEVCSLAVCDFSCTKNNCDCLFECSANTSNCGVNCQAGTICELDCGTATSCKATCQADSQCDINCTNVGDCAETSCAAGAECLLTCKGTQDGTCLFALCDGVETSCSGDIVACNRPCP